MADNRPHTVKESKGFRNRLKKVFRLGSQSTPQSQLNSSVAVAPPVVIAPPSVLFPPPHTLPPPAALPLPVSEPPVDPMPVLPAAPAPAAIDPDEAAKLRAKYTHFRILVIGRANAGKTTLLKRVCNTTEEPSIYDEGKNLVSYWLIVMPPRTLIVRSPTARTDLEGDGSVISALDLDQITDFDIVAGDSQCSSWIHLQKQPGVHLP